MASQSIGQIRQTSKSKDDMAGVEFIVHTTNINRLMWQHQDVPRVCQIRHFLRLDGPTGKCLTRTPGKAMRHRRT